MNFWRQLVCFCLKSHNIFEISSNSFSLHCWGFKDLNRSNSRFGEFSFLHFFTDLPCLQPNSYFDAKYHLNLCLEWFRFFLPWVGNLLEYVIVLEQKASNSTENLINKPYSMEEISSFPKNWGKNERFIKCKLIYFVTL